MWWAGLPAILKGYVDRVFSHGFAYAYGENGIEKLLSGKRDCYYLQWAIRKRHTQQAACLMQENSGCWYFEFTGIETIEHTFYTSVPSVDNDVRKQYLEEVKDVVNRDSNKNSGFNNRSFISSLISEYIFEECFLIHSYLPV